MTTIVYFENQTSLAFNLTDLDNNFYGLITPNSQMSLKLPFSQTFQKGYHLTSATGGQVSFALGINGEFAQISQGVVNMRITTLRTVDLPLTITKNNIGNVKLVQRLTQPAWVPKNTLLILFPANQANPNQFPML